MTESPSRIGWLRRFRAELLSGRSVSPDTLEETRTIVRSDTPDGFRVFYELIRNRPLPTHCYEWIERLYRAHSAGEFFGIEAFRGSTKTTTITETFTAYRIGLEPEKSHLFIQADEGQANKHAANVANIISNNAMWREVLFPNVVPDTTWGAMGYWVIDKNRGSDWARLRHKDPTLVGAGYTSAIITGSHPNGGLAIDDINNDKNTESDRENERVNRVLTETVYPGIEDPDVWHTFAQTPWTTRDALSVAKATGVYQWCRTPVLTVCAEDEPGAVWVEVKNDVKQVVYGVWAHLTWPEKFTPREIRKCYKTSLRRGFARMYLLDLSQAEGVNLRREWLHSFPAEKLSESWPVYIGIDYASSAGDLRYRDRDYCSISIGKAMPTGGVVLIDGFRDRLPRAEAVLKVRAIAGMYPTLVSIGVEAEGTGIEFYNDLALTTTLPVLPMRTKGRSKGTRFEDIMAPRFEMSQAWVSDVRTPFVTNFIDEWCGWPDSDHDDTLDSTYYMLAVSGMFLKDLEQSDDIPDPWWQPKKKRLDWSGMRERSV